MNQAPAADKMSEAAYRQCTDTMLAMIEATVDRWLQQGVIDIDPQRTGGLLELEFPGGHRIVVNTQPPLQELWLASPAAANHFRCVASRWVDTKDGRDFIDVLSAEASALAGKPLDFAAGR